MPLNTATITANLEAKYLALSAEYLAITSSAVVSDQGRSINFSAQADSILKQMDAVRLALAQLEGPGFVVSRMRA